MNYKYEMSQSAKEYKGKVTERNRKEANRQSPAFIDAVGPSAEDCSKPQPCERTSRS